MVKHAQTICWQQPTNCVNVFDHFTGLVLKGLNTPERNIDPQWGNEMDILIHFVSLKQASLSTLFSYCGWKIPLDVMAERYIRSTNAQKWMSI